ncbi:hypothetical protein A3L12_02310 [Thermococcus sp. P6]|uniref:family 4A encapsulin nanocompartment shell protein n=1 Tax=Thermococcus sp. P6 TaxID=122420 RepID=UPI000B59D912|nr:family 4A encapsulin nanocompartment shell protein [Thermococcus sp. P6]ASJ10209.1 hypothetical protein A3L12_02310 [Thermococcus sp. P6]
MRGDLIRVLSTVEEKANELKLEGYEPDVLLIGKKAYEFVKEQLNEEFGEGDEVLELSGFRVRVVEELEGDAVVIDSRVIGLGSGGAKRFRVIQ